MKRFLPLILWTAVPLLLAASYMQLRAGDVGDKGWLLLAAKMWLQGRKLSVDIIEVNPPLIIWLYALPVWVSLHVPMLADATIAAFTGLVSAALSGALCYRLLKLHPAFAVKAQEPLVLSILLLLLFIFFTPPLYFFDRDHIFLMFIFPYILRFMPGLANTPITRNLRIAIGFCAALGFCIKPYTLVVFILLQFLILLRNRPLATFLSLENCIIYCSAAAYFTCIWHFTPEYITVIVPMAWATYSAFSRRAIGIFYGIYAFIIAGVTFADVRPHKQTPFRPDIRYGFCVSIAFLLYALVSNGWGYTFHPLICMLLFLTAWVWLEQQWLEQNSRASDSLTPNAVFGQRACAINLLLNMMYAFYSMSLFFMTPYCSWATDCRKNIPYVEYLAQHHVHAFSALSEDFHKWASLARLTGAQFDTRYNHLWMVPKLVFAGEAFTLQHRWIVEEVGRGLAADMTHYMPPVIFVDSPAHFFGSLKTVFLPDMFQDVPEFKTAWSHYHYSSSIDECAAEIPANGSLATGCKYDIYSRNP